MKLSGKVVASMALAVVVAVAGLVAYYHVLTPPGPCLTLGGDRQLKSKLTNSVFGALTEYSLPMPGRMSNAIAVAPDGSVWFGEQSVPGVGHLFDNGTLVEYPWPTATHPSNAKCGFETSIWGIALWNGMVWGTDGDQNALVGVNPQNGVTRVVNVSGITDFPYTLSVGPDGALWFTALDSTAVLGRVAANYSVSTLSVAGIGKQVPAQVEFINSTLAYFITLDRTNSSGGLYSFDPLGKSLVVTHRLGVEFHLLSPDSLTLENDTVWVAQHGPSSVAAFDIRSGTWKIFPASPENYTATVLPYFVSAGDGKVWFNEHYGNRIAFIEPSTGTMTEYSESDPPVTNGSAIGNDLTIAPAADGLWFTSTTGNYIGFADGGYEPDFALSLVGGNTISVPAGGQATLRFSVDGNWKSPLSLQESDSENYTSIPKAVSMVPSVNSIPAGAGPTQFTVLVTAGPGLAPGEYTLGVTISNGLVLRTVFIFLHVT